VGLFDWIRSLWAPHGPRDRHGAPAAAAPPEPAAAPDEPDAPPAGDDVVVVPIEASIDLHFFAPRDVPSVVEEYLREARRAGLLSVRLIHGKGKGVQRQRVQGLLRRHPQVVSFASDGLGSTIVELRPRKTRPRAR
jgi:dsDNA-specific endonuclease/ATPase MutS2